MRRSVGFGFNRRRATGGGLSASTLTRTSGVTAYPVTVDFTRPIDWFDGITAVMQRSQDATFATGVTEVTNTITAAVTTYDFGLSNIVSGTGYFRLGAYSGSRPPVLNWSNIAGVGDAVAPTITSSAAPSGYQFIAGSLALTANKAATWAIVGGFDMAQFSISGSTLSWLAQSLASTFTVQVQATSYFGVASAVQTIILTTAVNTPTAFSFTDVTGAALSTVYTSNTITVAGLVGGAAVPVTVSGGEYQKNGGAWATAATTAVNGDTFAVRQTSASSNNATTNCALTIGSTSDTFSVSTPVVLSTDTTWSPTDKAASIALSNGNRTATKASGSNGTWASARFSTSKSSAKRYFELTMGTVQVNGGGVANGSESINTSVGASANSEGYFQDGGCPNGIVNPASTFGDGAVLGVHADCDAGTVKIDLNGVEQTHGPATGPLVGALLGMFSSNWVGSSCTLNTGHSPWASGPAVGEIAWDV